MILPLCNMGADLYFKVRDKSKADAFETFALQNEWGKILAEQKYLPLVVNSKDMEWANSKDCRDPVWFKQRFTDQWGKGIFKVSGISGDEFIPFEPFAGGDGREGFFEVLTRYFEAMNEEFEMGYFAGSCALTVEEHYFNLDQMQRITRFGELLTGHQEVKYPELMAILEKR